MYLLNQMEDRLDLDKAHSSLCSSCARQHQTQKPETNEDKQSRFLNIPALVLPKQSAEDTLNMAQRTHVLNASASNLLSPTFLSKSSRLRISTPPPPPIISPPLTSASNNTKLSSSECSCCTKCSLNFIQNNMSRSESQLPNLKLLKSFKVDASIQLLERRSRQTAVKTTRSKSCSCHSSNCNLDELNKWLLVKKKQPDGHGLSVSHNASSCSFQSYASDCRNKLDLPLNKSANSSFLNESMNSIRSSDTNNNSNSDKTVVATNKKLHASHSMYNFDASSFPEFNYIKTELFGSRNEPLPSLISTSPTVTTFLKNFDSSIYDLSAQTRSTLKPAEKLERSHSKSGRSNFRYLFYKLNDSIKQMKADETITKSNFELNTVQAAKLGYDQNLKESLLSKSCTQAMGKQFMQIEQQQQHHKTNMSSSQADLRSSSSHSVNSTVGGSGIKADKKASKSSHLFDFYSYYNNKYNQENQNKKNQRRESASTFSSKIHRFKLKQFQEYKNHSNPSSFNEYYIDEASENFNMKKFATSL